MSERHVLSSSRHVSRVLYHTFLYITLYRLTLKPKKNELNEILYILYNIIQQNIKEYIPQKKELIPMRK